MTTGTEFGDQWHHAVAASMQALKDEKAVLSEVGYMYANMRFLSASAEEREKTLAPLYQKLDEVRARILSWGHWFAENTPNWES